MCELRREIYTGNPKGRNRQTVYRKERMQQLWLQQIVGDVQMSKQTETTRAGANGVYWVGYVGGKPAHSRFSNMPNRINEYPSVFTDRDVAKSFYEDVRKVKIKEIEA